MKFRERSTEKDKMNETDLLPSLIEVNKIIKNLIDGDSDIVKKALYFWTMSLSKRCDAIDMSLNQFYSGQFSDLRDIIRSVWELENLSSAGMGLETFVEWMRDKPVDEAVQLLRNLWNDGFGNGVYSVLSGELIDKIPERLHEAEQARKDEK